MDTKFSSSIHALILISESETPMNSDQIAKSVGTNASYIRKLTTRLSKAGIIEGRRGVGGFRLVRKPEDISLLMPALSGIISDRFLGICFGIWKKVWKKDCRV